MKLWRKMGNKITLAGVDKPLTGRQYKAHQTIISGGFAGASKLLASLVSKTPYVSRYEKEEV